MIMETLLNTDFFLQIKNEENINIQKAYTDFIRKLLSFCKAPGDTASVHFALHYTRIEFVFLENRITEYKSGKK